jgi:hypothetical protein
MILRGGRKRFERKAYFGEKEKIFLARRERL